MTLHDEAPGPANEDSLERDHSRIWDARTGKLLIDLPRATMQFHRRRPLAIVKTSTGWKLIDLPGGQTRPTLDGVPANWVNPTPLDDDQHIQFFLH